MATISNNFISPFISVKDHEWNLCFKFLLCVVETSDTRGLKLKMIKKKSFDKNELNFYCFFHTNFEIVQEITKIKKF